MISVSQNWLDNQKKSLRAESDVRITFYNYNNAKIVSTFGIINRKELYSFNMTESGSIMGTSVHDVEVSFSIIKNSSIFDFLPSSIIKVEFGYLLNGSWEYIEKGIYQLTEKKTTENSKTIDCVAKQLNYFLIEQKYILGMPRYFRQSYNTPYQLYDYGFKRLFAGFDNTQAVKNGSSRIVGDANKVVDANTTNCFIGTFLPVLNYLEMLQTLSQRIGCSYSVKGEIDANNNYLTNYNVKYFAETDTIETTDYYISNFICVKYPEISFDKKYKNLIYQVPLRDSSNTRTFTFTQSDFGSFAYRQMIILPEYVGNATYSVAITPTTSTDIYYVFERGIMNYTGSTKTSYTITCTSIGVKWFDRNTYSLSTDVDATDNLILSNPLSNDTGTRELGRYEYMLFQKWAKRRKIYSFDLRIDPRIELYDPIIFIDNNGNEIGMYVESYSITYNGGFKGTIKARSLEE